MSDKLKAIVLDFEADLLASVQAGSDASALGEIRDRAFDRLRDVKEGPSPPPLETIFDVAGEIGIKLDMALKVIGS